MSRRNMSMFPQGPPEHVANQITLGVNARELLIPAVDCDFFCYAQ